MACLVRIFVSAFWHRMTALDNRVRQILARNRLLGLGVILIQLILPLSAAQAAECSLESIRWMAGSWHNGVDPEGAQERWVVAPGGVLMGSAWEFPTGKIGFAEMMTVRKDGDAVAMFLRHFDGGLSKAWEKQDAPMVFTAAHCDPDTVVFDGRADHAGEKMTYKRSGDGLLITGDFLHNGTPIQ